MPRFLRRYNVKKGTENGEKEDRGSPDERNMAVDF